MAVRRLTGFLLILATVASHGCATAAKDPRYDTIWPFAPNEPRIAYLKSLPQNFRKLTFWDRLLGEGRAAGVRQAYGVFARDGKVYVAASGNGYVLVMDERAQTLKALGLKGEMKLIYPIGVAVAADGAVYVSDAKQKLVFVYGPDGDLIRTIGEKGAFEVPAGLAIGEAAGRLYVADSYGHKVRVFSLAGKKLFDFGEQGIDDGQFHFPTNVSVDRRNGKVYVVDTQNFRVQVFDQDGKYLSQFGTLGDTGGAFARPKGAGVDTEGNVYVADSAFDNIQIFNEQAQFLMHFGSAGAYPGFFNLPAGVYVDENDTVYVVDSMNERVQIFQYMSERWKTEHPEEYREYARRQEAEDERRRGGPVSAPTGTGLAEKGEK